MMLIDSTMAIHLHSSSTLSYCRSIWSSGDVMGVKVAVPWNKVKKLRENFGSLLNKRNESRKSRIQATGKYLGSGSDHLGENGKSKYHPFEDISDSEAADAEKGQLTASETCRTIIEVNSKATLMFSGMINDEVHENIFWPDLPYLTDEHGNVYFQVNNDEDIMQSLTSDNNYVHVIIGLDTKEILSEMELSGPATIDFGIEEIDEEDSDFDEDEDEGEDDDDDEFDGDWVDILEVEEDHVDSDESLGDWAKLETMRASHPMYFAKKISEVTSDNPIDFMVQPPAGLAIQGLLRPAFIEERSVIKKHKLIQPDKDADINMNEKAADTNVENVGSVNGHAHPLVSPEDNSEWTGDLDKDNGLSNGTAFYKLEMIKIQLISAYGNQTEVEVEDYRKAHSDAIAHSASKIISRVSAAGEFSRLLTRRVWRSAISSYKTINPSLSPQPLQTRLYHGYGTQQQLANVFKGRIPFSSFESTRSLCIPLVLASVVGVGILDVAYADTNEAPSESPLPSDIPSSYDNLEEIAKKERHRLEDLIRSKSLKYGSYPRFTVAVKGQKIAIKFPVPAYCEIPRLIANLAASLNGGSPMEVQSWDSTVAWQLALRLPNEKRESGGSSVGTGENISNDSDLCVLIFRSLISPDKPEVEFLKKGSFSPAELEALVSIMQIAGERPGQSKAGERSSSAGMPSTSKSITSLEAMGIRVFGLDEPLVGNANEEVSWDTIAGYDQQKREIEDTVLLALRSPEVYDDIARGTRRKYESNRPRAVLFEGPPGTGKTSCARVIANQAGVPLLYVPLEVVMSKYYGESERLFGKVFSLANELPDGAIIFLDEVDSFAIARDSEIHEATRRILSVLLRQIDGFEQDKKVVVIAATNRKQDIDPALISRFDSMIFFGLPDHQNRQKIAAQYAKHLANSEIDEFASVTEGLSGRDIRDVCQQAERRWASKVIRNKEINTSTDAKEGSLPPLQEYIESAISRKKTLFDIEELRNKKQSHRLDKRPMDMS